MLWAAIRATQKRWPKAKCIVYTGDHDVDKAAILARVKVYWLLSLVWRYANGRILESVQYSPSPSNHHFSIPHNQILGPCIYMATFYAARPILWINHLSVGRLFPPYPRYICRHNGLCVRAWFLEDFVPRCSYWSLCTLSYHLNRYA